MLQRLLDSLNAQQTEGLFSYSLVIADNDHMRSAQPAVAAFSSTTHAAVTYCVEPRQSIALARNKAIENATGDFVAFIDDDEFPTGRWLLTLFEACNKYQADGVLGPVKPYFDKEVPNWVVKGKFYERPTYPTGFVIDWTKGRTGNVLLRRHLFMPGEQPFRPEFRAGEDQDFFRRMIERGHVFVWCNEAVAYEIVPPSRWRCTFMLRKALLRGTLYPVHPSFGVPHIVTSLIAVPAYTAGLPIALILGRHRLVALLTKLFTHIGTLLACLGIEPIKDAYVTE
jgi:succinoglycan biosynthesis protein ExoM